jgi:hypothetical protein
MRRLTSLRSTQVAALSKISSAANKLVLLDRGVSGIVMTEDCIA